MVTSGEVELPGDAFAMKACELIKECTSHLSQTRKEFIDVLDEFYRTRDKSINPDYLRRKYSSFCDEFERRGEVHNTLIRKASQWLQHGKDIKPELELELEIRLAEFEQLNSSMEQFVGSNRF